MATFHVTAFLQWLWDTLVALLPGRTSGSWVGDTPQPPHALSMIYPFDPYDGRFEEWVGCGSVDGGYRTWQMGHTHIYLYVRSIMKYSCALAVRPSQPPSRKARTGVAMNAHPDRLRCRGKRG